MKGVRSVKTVPPCTACAWICAVVLAAAASACTPSVTRESLSTPYQVAVGAYHALLADEVDAETARAIVDQALAGDASDDAIRMVAAQVELHEYRRSGSLRARERLLGQLVAIDASLRSGADVVDWVEARLYVTLGDVLTIDAQRDDERWLESDLAQVEDLWSALLRFDAADAAYRFARSLAADEPSRGLLRERQHAATAQVSSTLAVAATISAISRSPEGALGRLRAASLAQLEASLRADAPADVLADPPLRATVALDGSVHAQRAAAFEALATDASRRLRAACDDADMNARSDALDQLVGHLWWAAHHAVVAGTLGAEYDAVPVLGFLAGVATRGPEDACSL